MAGFLFGAGTDTPTAAELQRRRQIIDQLQQSSTARTPRNVGEGIAAIGQALAGRIGDRRLAEKENAERTRTGGQFDSIVSQLFGVGAPSAGPSFPNAPGASSKSPYPPVDPVETSRLPMPMGDVEQIAGAAIDRASQPPQAMVDAPQMAPPAAAQTLRVVDPRAGQPQAMTDAPQMAPPAAAQSLRVVDPQMTGGAGADALQGGAGGDTLGNPMAAKIVETAQALGIDPVDLATAISYETAGTFDPTKAGPTTQWGQHRGLIQFGEPQAAQYGVDWNDPLNSQLGAEGAIAKYLRDTGVQPGMGLMEIYSAINAGGVGRYNASDAHNGGAPGTVRDKVAGQMDGHRAKAAALLGGEFTPGGGGSDVMMGGPGGDRLGGGLVDPRIITQLAELAGNPYLDEGKRMIAQMLIQQQLGGLVSDPMKQLQMQKAQLEIEKLRRGGGGTEYGLNPQYGVDEDGNPVIIQIGKDGTAVQTNLPEGVRFQKEPIRVDAGTHFILLDPITRQPVGQIEKQLEEAAAATARGGEIGKQQGAAIMGLENAIAKGKQALDLILSIHSDPALASITGSFQGRIPAGTPFVGGGQAGDDLNAKIQQLQGKVFLEAFETLKGGGQITEKEGAKAEAAMARLTRAQSKEAYQAALTELADVIESGMMRAQSQAGLSGAQPDVATGKVPSDDDLLRIYGGD